MLSQAYILAALNNAMNLRPEVESEPQTVTTNGVNGYHAEAEKQTNGTNGIHANGDNHEAVATNGIETNGAEPKAIIPEVEEIPEMVIIHEIPISVLQQSGESHEQSLKSKPIYIDHTTSNRQPREWTEEQERIQLGSFDYLESLPGKNMRSKFIQAFNPRLKVPPEHLEVV